MIPVSKEVQSGIMPLQGLHNLNLVQRMVVYLMYHEVWEYKKYQI